MSKRDWLMSEIVDGLQLIVALALPGQPPADTIKLTASSWHRAFAARSREWEFEQDAPRIRAGFGVLLAELDSWPQPRQLLAAMPPRQKPLELPPGQQTDAHREAAQQWLPQIKQQIKELNEKRRSRRIKSVKPAGPAEIQRELEQIKERVAANLAKHAKEGSPDVKVKQKRKA